MSNTGIAALSRDFLLPVMGETSVEPHNRLTKIADEEVVMAFRAGANQFEAPNAITEVKPLDQPHGLEQVDCAINGSQITESVLQRLMDLTDGDWTT